MIKSQALKNTKFPDSPGVYLFKKGTEILYIGKATSLRDRLKSYFSNDLISTRGPLLVDMVLLADKIDFIKTDSVLEALILETNLIKKHQPKYNTKEKDNRSFNYVVITKENFPKVLIARGREIDFSSLIYRSEKLKYVFGPFPEAKQLKEAIKIIRRIFPFRDKCREGQGRACFNYQIGLCPGVCIGLISKQDYAKTINNIKLFFQGKKGQIIGSLTKEMKSLAKNHEFEKANEIKKTIFALSHIQDVSLLNTEKVLLPENVGSRIEAYDVAHLSGTNNVGVMVVWENNNFKKSDYRKFKINESRGDDTGALKEVLNRRLKHPEWPTPNLIVVDGGLAQINSAREILKQNNFQIPLVAVVKGEGHKPKAIIGDENIIKKHKKEILLVNNDAHRFAIKYHRTLRNKIG